MKQITVTFAARGHKNLLAAHETTFEITKEQNLTKQGDCIIAVDATKSGIDLPAEFIKATKKKGSQIIVTIYVDEYKEIIIAQGSSRLELTHPTDLVIRKSDYICSRTLAIKADKAAADFSRKIVEKLKNPKQEVKIKITVKIY